MIDLHLHSLCSDGSLTPGELVEEASRLGLAGIALTDHDTVSGVPEFLEAGERLGVETVPGVEISAEYQPGTLHVLGYFVDPSSRILHDHLSWMQRGREARNQEIFKRLNQAGLTLHWSEIRATAGNDVIGRPHFAEALIRRGYVSDRKTAFRKYLGRGRAAYVPRRRLTAESSIELIREAGGVPVLAHPYSLELVGRPLLNLVERLCDAGLQGIEVNYSGHNAVWTRRFRKLAKKFDLVATGGTDFHGDYTPDLTMGYGFGGLRVADEVIDRLAERRP